MSGGGAGVRDFKVWIQFKIKKNIYFIIFFFFFFGGGGMGGGGRLVSEFI